MLFSLFILISFLCFCMLYYNRAMRHAVVNQRKPLGFAHAQSYQWTIYGCIMFCLILAASWVIYSLFDHLLASHFLHTYKQDIPADYLLFGDSYLIACIKEVGSISGAFSREEIVNHTDIAKVIVRAVYPISIHYTHYAQILKVIITFSALVLNILVFLKFRRKVLLKASPGNINYKILIMSLAACAFVSTMITVAVVGSVFGEAFLFFKEIPILNFVFGTNWTPQKYDYFKDVNVFGVLPLLWGSMFIGLLSVLFASIVGISIAIAMTEFMPKSIRKIVKPVIEILSGIPTIVYGFFAIAVLAPGFVNTLNSWDIHASYESALLASFVMGIMITPIISSTVDDVISGLPNKLKEGAMALGATKLEMTLGVILPAAFPGIIVAIILAMSRAIGETVIVLMVAGLAANLSFNPLESITTITVQIVMMLQGDQEFGSVKTLSAFALSLTLFAVTLLLNSLALYVATHYRKKL